MSLGVLLDKDVVHPFNDGSINRHRGGLKIDVLPAQRAQFAATCACCCRHVEKASEIGVIAGGKLD